MINEIINSFLYVNQISSYDVGEPSRILASRTKYYKNLINNYDKTSPNDDFYKELIKIHTKLIEVEVTSKTRNHMLHDSVNFIERLINKRMQKEYERKNNV